VEKLSVAAYVVASFVATPPHDITISTDDPGDAIGQVENAKRRDVYRLVTATTRHVATDGRRNANAHAVRKRTPSVATPPQNAVFVQMNLGIPSGTTLENRHQASRRRQKTPYKVGELWDSIGTTLENRRLKKTPHVAQVNLQMPLETTLENRRQAL
jgi:hypothetical protein